MTSPIINGKRTALDIIKEYYAKKAREQEEKPQEGSKGAQKTKRAKPSSRIQDKGDFLLLEDIVCVGADGKPFEQYDALEVRKDIFREKRGCKTFTPYQAASYCEQQKLFNPSVALHCAILVKCFQEKGKNAQAKATLDQYKDYGVGYGWHATNTLVDWGNLKIIHYPQDGDFPSYGGNQSINKGRQKKVLPFPRKDFSDLPLGEALKSNPFRIFIQNLTGLQDPSILVTMGNYFQTEARVWVSSEEEVRAAWLGCNYSGFILYASGSLGDSYAARGVRATRGSANAP